MTTAVLVATSCRSLPGSPRQTGVSLPQFGAVRWALLAQGWHLVLASPAGGAVPVDAGTWSEEWAGAAGLLGDSEGPADPRNLNADVWIVLGGHGALVDLARDDALAASLAGAVETGATVVGIDHGAAALAAARNRDGTPVIAGRRVTGRSDSEERQVNHLGL